MSVGAELAAARRELGLSVEEVAARTNVTSERLRAIEQMGGVWLPSRVHLQGFVRAYAAAVQLDPDAIAQRYVAELDVAPPSYTATASGVAVPGLVDDSALDEFSSESGADSDGCSLAKARQPPWPTTKSTAHGTRVRFASVNSPNRSARHRRQSANPTSGRSASPASPRSTSPTSPRPASPTSRRSTTTASRRRADHDIAPIDDHEIRPIADHEVPPRRHTRCHRPRAPHPCDMSRW